MKAVKLFCLLSFLFLLGCPNDDTYKIDNLNINNSSQSDIYVFFRGGEPILYTYPPNDNLLVFANASRQFPEYYKDLLSDGRTLFIWVFDREIVETTPWEEIVSNNMYLIRYDLTLQDLENMNWTIDYTGE